MSVPKQTFTVAVVRKIRGGIGFNIKITTRPTSGLAGTVTPSVQDTK